jgi:hypothetical protein
MFDGGFYNNNNFGNENQPSRWSNNSNANHYNQSQIRRSKVFTPVTIKMVNMA